VVVTDRMGARDRLSRSYEIGSIRERHIVICVAQDEVACTNVSPKYPSTDVELQRQNTYREHVRCTAESVLAVHALVS